MPLLAISLHSHVERVKESCHHLQSKRANKHCKTMRKLKRVFTSLDEMGVFLEKNQNNMPGQQRHDCFTTTNVHLTSQNMLIDM